MHCSIDGQKGVEIDRVTQLQIQIWHHDFRTKNVVAPWLPNQKHDLKKFKGLKRYTNVILYY